MAEGSGSAVIDEKEMKRRLKEQLCQMSPDERKKWLEDVSNNEI